MASIPHNACYSFTIKRIDAMLPNYERTKHAPLSPNVTDRTRDCVAIQMCLSHGNSITHNERKTQVDNDNG